MVIVRVIEARTKSSLHLSSISNSLSTKTPMCESGHEEEQEKSKNSVSNKGRTKPRRRGRRLPLGALLTCSFCRLVLGDHRGPPAAAALAHHLIGRPLTVDGRRRRNSGSGRPGCGRRGCHLRHCLFQGSHIQQHCRLSALVISHTFSSLLAERRNSLTPGCVVSSHEIFSVPLIRMRGTT